jgi:hypothetical protein
MGANSAVKMGDLINQGYPLTIFRCTKPIILFIFLLKPWYNQKQNNG